ncbi:MAG: tetratricopeptide repeat protein [Bacteroidales bacterium]|jgi:tetratricopeptide (TPR) repeat protein
MTYSEIKKKKHDISLAITENRLLDSFNILDTLKASVSSSDIHSRYNSILDTYRNMLKYSFELVPDPERGRIYNELQQSLFEIADDIEDHWVVGHNLFNRKEAIHQAEYLEKELDSNTEQIMGELSGQSGEDKPDNIDLLKAEQRKKIAGKSRELFYYLWLRNHYSNSEKNLVRRMVNHEKIDWSTNSLMVSAVTLSQLRHFDREKIYLLYDLMSVEDFRIRQRAIIGLFINLMVYSGRILLYKDIMDRLKSVSDDELLVERFLAILIQFIRAGDTEKITKKIQEEIVPEVLKIRSELEDKLKLKDLLEKENFEEKNPEWENFFKDAPDVYQKLEQFSRMQIEGADVFMGAFANLKHFDFFKEMANWFLPFKGENETVLEAFEGVGKEIDVPAFIEGFEQSTVMCNSDKYSFCLNIQHMPDEQRKMMLELFNMELQAMNEMNEDEFKLKSETKNKIINTQYLQDLYRFFKLNPNRKEFENIFGKEIDVLNSEVLKVIFHDQKTIRNLAEFYFASDKYPEALHLFHWLNEKKSSFELLEKMGFCNQKTGKFNDAIELYKQAELFDKNKIWLQKKLGYCYRKAGDIENAVHYYKQVVETEPNDPGNLAYLGQLFMDADDYEEALKYYYRVEYENPKNEKVYRPIGWCSFVLGKYETAIKYFLKIIKVKALKNDYLNIGHCYWASGKMDMALESYRKAVDLSGNDGSWFRNAFYHDSGYLRNTGVDDLDVALMIDYVLIG